MKKDILKGQGFILRPLKISDAQGYLECHQDEAAKKAFTSVPKTLSESKKEVEKAIDGMKVKNPTHAAFAIIVNNEFAGFISLHDMTTHPRYKHQAIVGYGIHKNFRGRGLATKALKKITTYGFKILKLKRICGMTRTFNVPSQKVLKKAGYKLEGILKKNKFMNGKYYDDMIYAKVI